MKIKQKAAHKGWLSHVLRFVGRHHSLGPAAFLLGWHRHAALGSVSTDIPRPPLKFHGASWRWRKSLRRDSLRMSKQLGSHAYGECIPCQVEAQWATLAEVPRERGRVGSADSAKGQGRHCQVLRAGGQSDGRGCSFILPAFPTLWRSKRVLSLECSRGGNVHLSVIRTMVLMNNFPCKIISLQNFPGIQFLKIGSNAFFMIDEHMLVFGF